MKRILVCLLAVLFLFSMAACGSPAASSQASGSAESAASAETAASGYWWEQYRENPEDDITAPGVDANGQVTTTGGYVLFTSDTHCCTFLAKDLLELANSLVKEDGGEGSVSLFALGGDFADNGILPDTMTILKHAIEDTSPDTVAVYTKGNHEGGYTDEEFRAATGMSRIGETAVNTDGLYHFYSFGAFDNQCFLQEDIDALADYLGSLKDDKPVFIMSHFPIHYLEPRRSVYGAGGEELLELLNQYPQVIFLWGHNHSEADPSYSTVRFPGETITYGPELENTMELNFTYLSMGSLRFGVNGENGVLVKVNEDGSVNYRFLALDQEPADDTVWVDMADSEFETLVATNPHVISEITCPVINDEYFKTINSVQVFLDSPRVGRDPDTEATEYSDRYDEEKIEWLVDGSPMKGDTIDFDTAYTAAVTLKAKDGYTFAADLADRHVSGINPSYQGPMTDEYTVGPTTVNVVDDTTVVLEYTYPNTAAAFDPVAPATEIEEGHKYVLASNDDTSRSVYYKYEYQEGARRPNYKPWLNDIVIQDGNLVSIPDDFEIFTAVADDFGFLLYSDASLLDHGYGENSIQTLNVLGAFYRADTYEMEASEPGELSIYNNWNIDEDGNPYVNSEGAVCYPCNDGATLTCTNDPAECNMRLYDVTAVTDDPNFYIVVRNITSPVAGETPEADVTWSPADSTFKPDTVYTATVDVPLTRPVSDETAAFGRINGQNVDMTLSADGLTATFTYEFAPTGHDQTPADGASAKKADKLEDGKTYMIVADGMAMTSQRVDNFYLLGSGIDAAGDTIKGGITNEMIFTAEAAGEDGVFYLKGADGYLVIKSEEGRMAWGTITQEEPGLTVKYTDGQLLVTDNGMKIENGPAGGQKREMFNYFYYYNGHFNFSMFHFASKLDLYEVDLG